MGLDWPLAAKTPEPCGGPTRYGHHSEETWPHLEEHDGEVTDFLGLPTPPQAPVQGVPQPLAQLRVGPIEAPQAIGNLFVIEMS